uniref:PPM-type phosphatase domain-containing protein n=1 Tax=Callorhinchus milii TaxID=7868 RepID=A0A4W3KGI0_CALMI
VLCKNGKGYRLTEKHDTSNSNERKRILQTGGQISKNKKYGLVDGRIQTTRGLGYLGDEMLKKCIIPFPYTASVPIDPSCQFLILASGGFWKVLSIQQVISISLQVLSFYSGSFEALSIIKRDKILFNLKNSF